MMMSIVAKERMYDDEKEYMMMMRKERRQRDLFKSCKSSNRFDQESV